VKRTVTIFLANTSVIDRNGKFLNVTTIGQTGSTPYPAEECNFLFLDSDSQAVTTLELTHSLNGVK